MRINRQGRYALSGKPKSNAPIVFRWDACFGQEGRFYYDENRAGITVAVQDYPAFHVFAYRKKIASVCFSYPITKTRLSSAIRAVEKIALAPWIIPALHWYIRHAPPSIRDPQAYRLAQQEFRRRSARAMKTVVGDTTGRSRQLFARAASELATYSRELIARAGFEFALATTIAGIPCTANFKIHLVENDDSARRLRVSLTLWPARRVSASVASAFAKRMRPIGYVGRWEKGAKAWGVGYRFADFWLNRRLTAQLFSNPRTHIGPLLAKTLDSIGA